mmetsp:Transcript_33151/g.91634  ORF Transcript_33151/g.91634 Transcript_33151/m.91634 type:complete len:269 (-) Transcript_33151:119-925(-)
MCEATVGADANALHVSFSLDTRHCATDADFEVTEDNCGSGTLIADVSSLPALASSDLPPGVNSNDGETGAATSGSTSAQVAEIRKCMERLQAELLRNHPLPDSDSSGQCFSSGDRRVGTAYSREDAVVAAAGVMPLEQARKVLLTRTAVAAASPKAPVGGGYIAAATVSQPVGGIECGKMTSGQPSTGMSTSPLSAGHFKCHPYGALRVAQTDAPSVCSSSDAASFVRLKRASAKCSAQMDGDDRARKLQQAADVLLRRVRGEPAAFV